MKIGRRTFKIGKHIVLFYSIYDDYNNNNDKNKRERYTVECNNYSSITVKR